MPYQAFSSVRCPRAGRFSDVESLCFSYTKICLIWRSRGPENHLPMLYSYFQMEPVLCRICGNAFSKRSSLRQYEMRHSKQAPYACCNKTVLSKDTFKWHWCHQHGETCPHICEVCGKGFALQTDLRRHQARETRKLKLTCDICGF